MSRAPTLEDLHTAAVYTVATILTAVVMLVLIPVILICALWDIVSMRDD